MEIVIAGASGFIGRRLVYYLYNKGHKVSVITRKDLIAEKLVNRVDGKDVVVNLMGEPISGRWSKSKKKRILKSRVFATERLVNAVLNSENKAKTFVQASAVGIYDSVHWHKEDSKQLAEGFLADVVRKWEAEAEKVNKGAIRLIKLRMGVVLGKEGGIMKKLMIPYKFRIGIQLGRGEQPFPYIHITDLVKAIDFIIQCSDMKGVINIVTPIETTFRQLNDTISLLLKPLLKITIPDSILNLIFGEGSSMLIEGQHVVPGLLTEKEFAFQYAELSQAIKEIISDR